MRHIFLPIAAAAALVSPALVGAQAPSAAIKAAVANPARTPANLVRDRYRHPAQTLAFFGVKPTDTVVEFTPAAGWYTEILGPLTNGKGRYVALVGSAKGAESAGKMLEAKRALVGPAAMVATMDAAAGTSTVPAGSADVVLTFRNIHNLTMGGGATAANAFKIWFGMLKPGGTLGIVEHRLPAGRDVADEKSSGYLKRATVVALAQSAGFRLAGESNVNANPKDKANYAQGVWTLPPVLRGGDVDRAKYVAIGESDRMTLKFIKPR